DLSGSAAELLWAATLTSSLTGNTVADYVNGASADWFLRNCNAARYAADCNGFVLLDGTRTLTGYLYDLAGNQSGPGTLTLTTDYTAPDAPVLDLPAAQDSGFSDSDNITNSPVVDLSGSAAELLWAATLTSSLTGNTVVSFINGTSSDWALRNCNAARYAADCNGFVLLDGTRTLTGYLYDLAGNQSGPGTLTLTTDYTAPDAPVLDLPAAQDSGFSDSDNITNSPVVDLSGSAAELLWAATLTSSLTGNTVADYVNGASADWFLRNCNAARYAADCNGFVLLDGTRTLTGYLYDLAGNQSGPGTLTLTTDYTAPDAPVLDLPAGEDSGVSNSDNITNVDVWHFFAAPPTESTVTAITELAPNGRLDTSNWPGDVGSACHCYYFPDTGGGLGADHRQGLWSYTARFTDLAGNASALSNLLAISFDSIAPAAPVLDLPAGEDSGVSNSDNITNVDVWHFFAAPPTESTVTAITELAPNGRLDTSNWPGDVGSACHCYYFPDTGGGLGADHRQGLWSYTARFTDLAGNASALSNLLAISFDSIAPVSSAAIAGTPGDNGWWKAGSPVQLALSATDNLSGVAATSFSVNGGAAQNYTAPVTFTDGVYHVTFSSSDIAGNAEASQTVDFMVDQTQPDVTIGGVTDGATYFLNGAPTPTFTASDALSGIATQVATLTPPSTASGAGFYVYRVTVTDSAGNVTVATATYLVTYRFTGFLSPLTPGGTYKQGRNLPVKFILLDSALAPVANAHGTLYVDGVSVGDFVYMGFGIYQFNVNTSSLSLGRHTLTAQLDDTTTHSIDIFIRS
ncbi:MAG TPA: Ig-like domain repeat protein, partial [Candidatus Dormibacteraeota bacterium]